MSRAFAGIVENAVVLPTRFREQHAHTSWPYRVGHEHRANVHEGKRSSQRIIYIRVDCKERNKHLGFAGAGIANARASGEQQSREHQRQYRTRRVRVVRRTVRVLGRHRESLQEVSRFAFFYEWAHVHDLVSSVDPYNIPSSYNESQDGD